MKDGLYAVYFRSAGDEGAGVVAVSNGSVNGGDYGYAYQGSLEDEGPNLKSTLSVFRFNQGAESIFGAADQFELELSGAASQDGFQLTGNVKGWPDKQIEVLGRYLKPLV